jgi:hypothetical protein
MQVQKVAGHYYIADGYMVARINGRCYFQTLDELCQNFKGIDLKNTNTQITKNMFSNKLTWESMFIFDDTTIIKDFDTYEEFCDEFAEYMI